MSQSVHSDLEREIQRRRTFAIISHPDAGKTTLTEKLLLYSGAIHLAGAVKSKKAHRSTTSDWMELEKQRGISVSSTVLQFEFHGTQINLLDTPGHKDFSEDTYRTLMAADAAVMLIDAAKGVEPQTRKLFEVCRMRGIPIFTFVNKMDRPGREPLDLVDELEKVLGIRSCPMTWPLGSGDRFKGVYDRENAQVLLYDSGGIATVTERLEAEKVSVSGPEDKKFLDILSGPQNDQHEGEELHEQLKAEMELLDVAGDAFDAERILNGELTPIYFGSALSNFGVESFLRSFIGIAPPPGPRKSTEGAAVPPSRSDFSAFIFKIQANMDPKHRDRVAFMRICSGVFKRNCSAKHPRIKKEVKLSQPLNFFGQERVLVEEAWPGDILGIVDTTGTLRIGDTLCLGKPFRFEPIPSFSPEFFGKVFISDPMKRKQLKKGLDQLAEEGVVQVYAQWGLGDKDPILGAVGALQFEVLSFRLKGEYGVDIKIERLPYTHARWMEGSLDLEAVNRREDSLCLEDRDGLPVVLFRSDWALRWAEDHYEGVKFLTTAPLSQIQS